MHIPGKVEPFTASVSLTRYDSIHAVALQHGALAWTVCHGLYNTASSVPDWTGWLSVAASDRHEQLSNIGYLRPIMHPITQVSTVHQCLQSAAEISQRLQQSYIRL